MINVSILLYLIHESVSVKPSNLIDLNLNKNKINSSVSNENSVSYIDLNLINNLSMVDSLLLPIIYYF